MLNIKKEHRHLFRQSFPVVPISLRETTKDVLKSCWDEKVLLLQYKLLNAEGLARVFGVRSTGDFLTFFTSVYDVFIKIRRLILSLTKNRESSPKSSWNCVECVIACVLRVIGHSTDVLCVHPLTPYYGKSILFLLNLDNLTHHLNSDCKVKPLYLKRVFGEVFLLSASIMGECNLASRNRLSFLHLVKVAKLVSQSIAPSRELKSC